MNLILLRGGRCRRDAGSAWGRAAAGAPLLEWKQHPHFLAWDPGTLGELSDQIRRLLFSFLINTRGS